MEMNDFRRPRTSRLLRCEEREEWKRHSNLVQFRCRAIRLDDGSSDRMWNMELVWGEGEDERHTCSNMKFHQQINNIVSQKSGQ